MVLDKEIRKQLAQYLELLEAPILIKLSVDNDPISQDMTNLVNELAELSSKITVVNTKLARTPSFSINRVEQDMGVTFAGIPLGHEFTSLVLALLQVSGRAPKVTEQIIEQIKTISGNFNFESYISLSCHNCPEVVQALNLLSIINPNITHTMIDGATFKQEIADKNIMAVPCVYLNGELFDSGRMSLEEILAKITPALETIEFDNKTYDVLIVGGGPAGASAAIYAARKGLSTAILAERFGGQIQDTMSIENLAGIKHTQGPKLAQNLEEHVREYNIELFKVQKAVKLHKNNLLELELNSGAKVQAKTLILATGARYRQLGIPGENEFKNKGVAYCPHCDGPIFKGKRVAVIGGGNSGVEAAIDLAGIVEHVTLFEYLPELKADIVLQQRLYSLPNVTVLKNVQTTEIIGTEKVTGISYIDRATNNTIKVDLEGVFIQIGLIPNTDWLKDSLELNACGEIIVDSRGATNIPGVFAAGDCTNTPYKQIVISMGSGATAALSAFDYLIRN